MHNNIPPNTTPVTVCIDHADGMTKCFCQSTITFGRNPSCDVVFPADLVIVSRLHAMINRRGNQYILKNLSPNACYVNNIKKEECILKEEDFIRFADGGPVVVFTLSYCSPDSDKPITTKHVVEQKKDSHSENLESEHVTEPPTLLTRASADFTFQYGTCIKSFHQISVIVGKGPCCDFVIAHPQVDEKQFQFHFRNNQYILRDLSETQSTRVNNVHFIGDIQLESGDIITLNVGNVQLEYLGEGRVLEYAPKKYTTMSSSDDLQDESSRHPHNPDRQNGLAPSVFDVFEFLPKKH